jgi:hypothetical protein
MKVVKKKEFFTQKSESFFGAIEEKSECRCLPFQKWFLRFLLNMP